jgi:hypothetical protein
LLAGNRPLIADRFPDADIDRLVAALSALWLEVGLPFEHRAEAAE